MKIIPEWIYIENFLKFIYFKWGFSFEKQREW